MLGGFILGLVAGGLAVWKWRDSIGEYIRDNAGPARSKADALLGTVQERSEHLLDRAKRELSSRLESTRGKVRTGAARSERDIPTE